MQVNKNKTLAIFVTVILALSTAVSLIAIPGTGGQTQSSVKTFAFIGATPNPVGVNQETLLHIGISAQLATASQGWKGLSVIITRPDGTTETITGIDTDSTGGTGRVFVPTMTGNYTVQTHFPEQKMPSSAGGVQANTTMRASDSEKLTLIVQEDAVPVYPGIPLPTEYWTRPINSQFREWYSISGSSWMMTNGEFNDAPASPHALWAKPLTIGGLVGGELGLVGSGGSSVAFENGDAYEGKWSGSLILAGRLYYQDAPGGLSGVAAAGSPVKYHCVDLRTGEEYWAKTFLDNRTIAFGQLYYWESYNYQGVFPYLWVTTGSGSNTNWTAFDAYTGDYRATITNVPSGTRIIGPRGEVYIYSVNQAAGYMTLWNMSALVSMAGSFGSSFMGRTLNASATSSSGALTTAAQRAWAWNISIPKGLPGSVRAVALGDRVVGSSTNTTDVVVWAFSLKTDAKGIPSGSLLFNKDWKTPSEWIEGNLTFVTYGSSWCTTDMTNKLGLVWMKELRQYYAFSLETGDFLWVTEPEAYLNIYGPARRVYDGRLISYGYAGVVNCYNITTGKLMWTYEARDQYTEILWSDNWPMFSYATGSGMIYLFFMEHSGNQPLSRGAPTLCLNTTTGDVVWRVDGLYRTTNWGGTPIMGDSVIAMYNTYDQQVYAIGKGPSAMKVTAPNVGIPLGGSVVIQGSVTDVSPGVSDNGIAVRFPNGVPAVSDESQGEWMKYVYAQFPKPTNATGVNVRLTVLDSNNNVYDIGTATTDSSGTFGFSWEPEIPGQYTVYANFQGSAAYYPSSAQTYVNVEESTEPTPTQIPLKEASLTDTYFLPAVAAIIIAIVIVGALNLLVAKKRP